MKHIYHISAVVLFVTLLSCAGTGPVQKELSQQQNAADQEQLTLDPSVRHGVLDNGLTYFIRENGRPENRIELRLAVNAGSILEDEDQRGLAHFCEHMAFNGTKNFEKHELVDFLESIGMRFGPELNAYTSFDETTYILQVPSDSLEIVEKAVQILEDWAHNVSYEAEEIDRERGVIIEEWRLGRGARSRMRDKQFPILFHNSRYAERLPIGLKEIVENAQYDTLRRFYRDWYRPDLMAVVAVGDFDPDWMEKLLKDHFSRLENPPQARERTVYEVPDHNETLYAVATDKEATGNEIGIYWKLDVSDQKTETDYRTMIVENIFNAMFNERLTEIARKPEPPFLSAYSGKGRFVLSKEVYMLSADVRDNGIERGFEAILTEAERIRRFGFTESELERMKTEMLRSIELMYNERDKTESGRYASEYVRVFTMDEPAPGIEKEYELYNRFVPGITLAEVNTLASEWISDGNRVIMVNAPEKEGVSVPTEQELDRVMERVATTDVEAYVDAVSDQPLIAITPDSSPVVETSYIDQLGVTEWTLANGIKVILKPTDFKNDEIMFSSYSPGGTSLVPDDTYVPAATATSVVVEGGLGDFDVTALNKKLAGKIVQVSPYIGQLREGFSGSCSPADVETMFKMIYLYATSPRKDSESFDSFMTRVRGYVENRSAQPETAFRDTLSTVLTSYHPRSRPWTMELLDELDLDASFDFYRDRFAETDDFTFFFVGAFDPEMLRPFVETYLGGLPSVDRNESWRDVDMHYPEGVVMREVYKGMEQKSLVSIVFHGDFDWTRENRYKLGALEDVMRIRLREVLREDAGGTYGVGVSSRASHWPDEEYEVRISFGADPDRVEELTGLVFSQLDTLKTIGTTDEYLLKVKETHRREREVNLKENSFWLNILESYYYNGSDPLDILAYDGLVDALTLDDIRSSAETYLDTGSYVKVVLYPEK